MYFLIWTAPCWTPTGSGWTSTLNFWAGGASRRCLRDYTDYVTHHSAPDAARYTRERFSLPETPEEIMEGWMSMARSAYAHTLPLKPGVPAFLDACRRRGHGWRCSPPACLPCAAPPWSTTAFWTALRAVYTTAELGIEKRDPALYCLAAERSGVPPQSCLLFEDSPSYCAAARQAGFTVVGVFDPFCPRWGDGGPVPPSPGAICGCLSHPLADSIILLFPAPENVLMFC